ncbi:MAG: PDDEXK nuclease domain-containing protein [Candidatus Margulisiibacteriota bacterium]
MKEHNRMPKNPVQQNIYLEIKTILETARSNVYKAVNFTMVQAYWNIGRVIVEEEQRGNQKADYGKYLIKEISAKLTEDFGKGFTETNLKYFRQFYIYFPISHAVRDQLAAVNNNLYPELSWTHYRLLLKIEKRTARDFYIKECIVSNWSTRQLERQINSLYYERLLASSDKKGLLEDTRRTPETVMPQDIIKDPYVLEFLELKENKDYLEKDIEKGVIDKLQEFLLELGKGFAYVARQQRITLDGDHFYIDLVFYNYILKCFLLIDLKVGRLTHKDIGQMDFYVRYYEDRIKNAGDNPTIGLILCSEKNEAVARYSVLHESKQLFASKYKIYLPSEEELARELESEIMRLRLKNE